MSVQRTARYLSESLESPWTIWMDDPLGLVEEVFWPLDPRNARLSVRWLDGRRMRTSSQMFDEFDAALQFPSYFGRNWNAVIDCLRDTNWEQRSSYVLLVRHAEELAGDSPADELEHLLGVFRSVGEQLSTEWQASHDQVRRPTPFHVLFHINATARDAWLSRLVEARLTIPQFPTRNPESWE